MVLCGGVSTVIRICQIDLGKLPYSHILMFPKSKTTPCNKNGSYVNVALRVVKRCLIIEKEYSYALAVRQAFVNLEV